MNFPIVADESVDFRIVSLLREKGISVYSIMENQASISDKEVLEEALKRNALLITEDKDFGELVFRFQLPHCGILLIRMEEAQTKIEEVTNSIIKYHSDMIGKFSVIDQSKLRIKQS
jgi:predicted nuclease of predicted toxin-antitoxin system